MVSTKKWAMFLFLALLQVCGCSVEDQNEFGTDVQPPVKLTVIGMISDKDGAILTAPEYEEMILIASNSYQEGILVGGEITRASEGIVSVLYSVECSEARLRFSEMLMKNGISVDGADIDRLNYECAIFDGLYE